MLMVRERPNGGAGRLPRIEVIVSELRRLPPGEPDRVSHGSDGPGGIDAYDAATQGQVPFRGIG
jgi:hypothetical protein